MNLFVDKKSLLLVVVSSLLLLPACKPKSTLTQAPPSLPEQNSAKMEESGGCSIESLSEKERDKWQKHTDGMWYCESLDGCDICGKHYNGNVHIENNEIMCANQKAEPEDPDFKRDNSEDNSIETDDGDNDTQSEEQYHCKDYRIIYDDDISYIEKFSKRHQVSVSSGKEVTWKSVEDKFAEPLITVDPSKNVVSELVAFLDNKQDDDDRYKYTCVLDKEIAKNDRFEAQIILCGHYRIDENGEPDKEYYCMDSCAETCHSNCQELCHDQCDEYNCNDCRLPSPGTYNEYDCQMGCNNVYSALYLVLTYSSSHQQAVYDIGDRAFISREYLEFDGSGDVLLMPEIYSAPFLDTTGYYLRYVKKQINSFEFFMGGGTRNSYLYSTILLAGDKLRKVVTWLDTDYSSSDSVEGVGNTTIIKTEDDYIETTITFDGNTIDDSWDPIESRWDFLKHKSIESRKEFLEHKSHN